MNEIKQMSEYFLLALSLGLSGFSILVSTNLTGAGFFRLLQSIVLSSLVILGVIEFFSHTFSLVFLLYLVCLLLILLSYRYHLDEKSKFMWLIYFLQFFFITYISYLIYSKLDLFVYYLITTGLVGITMYTMVLGHYYLVVPKLSEKPLLNATEILWVMLVLKIGASYIGWLKGSHYFEEGTMLGAGYSFNWMILLMRVLWGYLALFILSLFAWKLCRIRSIQSATGLFYVMVFFMLVGELISSYLYFNFGLML